MRKVRVDTTVATPCHELIVLAYAGTTLLPDIDLTSSISVEVSATINLQSETITGEIEVLENRGTLPRPSFTDQSNLDNLRQDIDYSLQFNFVPLDAAQYLASSVYK